MSISTATPPTPVVESLESRRHFSADLTINGVHFFVATDSAHGAELWKDNGIGGPATLVKDIFPGAVSSSPDQFAELGGKLYFTANDGAHGFELWKSDGTTGGTLLVKDIYTASNKNAPYANSYPSSLFNFNGTLFFAAYTDKIGNELYKSDGTSAGTVLVKDIFAGSTRVPKGPFSIPGRTPHNSNPDSFQVVDGILYFRADDGVFADVLYTTDGTSAGTVPATNAPAVFL